MANPGIGDLNSGLAAPAYDAAAVTPSDSTDLASPSRSIYVGGAGNVAVTMKGGAVVTFTAVPVGTFLPVRATRIMATNTTATLLVALF